MRRASIELGKVVDSSFIHSLAIKRPSQQQPFNKSTDDNPREEQTNIVGWQVS